MKKQFTAPEITVVKMDESVDCLQSSAFYDNPNDNVFNNSEFV
ncbi:MAG: hypothetical protein SPJ19_05825 [Candidatus Borkfalkiaceae bacterium]|nr:hypothetical protein [Christensenellaceae bacterium]